MSRFSLIMPTKDRPQMILGAIGAILAQDFQDWELLIVDGGASVKSILPQDSRIKYSRQIGAVDRRGNAALLAARGEILSYQADDDLLRPWALSLVSSAIGARKWLYGLVSYGEADVPSNPTWGSPFDYERLRRENHVPAPATFWTREARDIVGGWDEENDRSHDWAYWLKLGARWEPLFVRHVLAFYRIHPGSATNQMSAEYKEMWDAKVRRQAVEGYQQREP